MPQLQGYTSLSLLIAILFRSLPNCVPTVTPNLARPIGNLRHLRLLSH